MFVGVNEPNKGIFCFHADIDMYYRHIKHDYTTEECYRVPNWLRNTSLSMTLFVVFDREVMLSITFFDDFNRESWITKYYDCDFSNYRQKTHELLNWLKDQENRVMDTDQPFLEDWFPEL